MLAQEPVVFCRVLRRRLGSSAGGESLRFLVDFLKFASFACNPEGPGFDVSALEDPGRESFVLERLTFGLKRAAQSNLEELLALDCSFSRLLLRGLGLEAERERLALFWSFPCFTRAPGGAAEETEATAEEEEEEVEAEDEESVMVLHPALAEVADFEASLVGFGGLSSAPVATMAALLLFTQEELSVLFLLCSGDDPGTPPFLLCALLVDGNDVGGAECSWSICLFLGLLFGRLVPMEGSAC